MANTNSEILITCDFEENVVDIESDASTMTSNTASGTKRKRNQVIQIPDVESGNLLSKKPKKCNILELLSAQGSGNISSSVFNENTIALKTNRLKLTNFFSTVHPEIHVSDCEYIRTGQDGSSILGVWKGDQYDAVLYKLGLNLSPRRSSEADARPSFLNGIELIGPFFSKSEIRDICDTYCRNQNYALYVGNYYCEESYMQSSAVLCNFANNSPTMGKQYISLRELLCCCGSQNGDVFATGSEEGVYVYQDQEYIFHNQYIGRVSSVEFNSAGNVLYCGVNNSGITIFDRRESPWKNSTIKTINYSSGITETKLFSNENNMVISDMDGNLTQIDLRKREPLFGYRGHVGTNKKTPFSLNENAGILCSTGMDKITRLWSLHSGSHICSIEPPTKSNRVHSCLIADENRWIVAIFQTNRMYIMEPEQ